MLYLPIATPGSGKSYLANQMTVRGFLEPDAVVSPDRYREVLTGDRTNQKVNGEVFKIVDTIVDTRISHGLDVYLDATNLNEKLRNKLLTRLTKLSYDFSLDITILLSDAPRSLVERQNTERRHPVPQHVFDRFYEQSEAFDPIPLVKLYGARVRTFEEMLEALK